MLRALVFSGIFISSGALFGGVTVGIQRVSLAESPSIRVSDDKETSVELDDADIRSAFTVLAETVKRNIVIHPSVQGRVSIRLKGVPILEVMKVLAESNGLRMSDRDGIITISPLRGLN